VSWFYRTLLRPALFAQDSEKIHDRTLRALSCAARHRLLTGLTAALYAAPELPVDILGLRFPNPVGLAAGLDKLAQAVPIWPALGFGFSELGAVTWHPQPGNPPPRLFRAIKDQALVNSMGFNNAGARALAATLAQWKQSGLWPSHPVGINLGKSKITPLANAAQDYANTFRLLRPLADFFVVNVSSPNTPDLRQLQDKSALDEILAALQEIQKTPALPVPSAIPIYRDRWIRAGTALPLSPIRNPQSTIRNPFFPSSSKSPPTSLSPRWMKSWNWPSRARSPASSPPTPPSPGPKPATQNQSGLTRRRAA
jgi:dihydroorotate dehydrogenase